VLPLIETGGTAACVELEVEEEVLEEGLLE
jgi:hypothetical protein